jgi:hypothetical protein
MMCDQDVKRKFTPEKLAKLRSDAETGQYTLTDLSVMHLLSYGCVARLCRGIKVKAAVKAGGHFNKRDPSMEPPATVEQAIKRLGHDEDFEARNTEDWHPVSHTPGSGAKVAALARRAELGQPLWHPNDRIDFAGLTRIMQVGRDNTIVHDSGPGIRVCAVPRVNAK